jgi:hypothetical protein
MDISVEDLSLLGCDTVLVTLSDVANFTMMSAVIYDLT